MGALTWVCRCVPGFSIVACIVLSFLALADRLWRPHHRGGALHGGYTSSHLLYGLTAWQIIYIGWSLFAHVCACLLFPLRLCWASWHISDEIKAARAQTGDRPQLLSPKPEKIKTESPVLDGPLARVPTPANPAPDDVSDSVIHAVIIPAYKEDIDTLRETLAVLASHLLASTCYDVYLALEQRDPEAENTAAALICSFSDSFRHISFTIHPSDIKGEVAGKSSNVSWAARQLSHNYVDADIRKRCVITVMDSDTHLQNSYFLLLTKFHRRQHGQADTLYVTPIIFDRNSHEVPVLVRVADILWCGAGLSGLYQGSPICIPTSVYSISMTLAGTVGGWDTGPESIGEDLHMYLKCYFATSGRLNVQIIYSPASQSNVSSDTKGWRGSAANIRARYRQALRHMWGALDTGYAIEKALERLWRKNDEKLSDWVSNANNPSERVPRWVNDTNLTHFTPPNLYDDRERTQAPMDKMKLLILMHRLYEAHFLPLHLTIALVSSVIYSFYVPPVVTPPLLLWLFQTTDTLRVIGIVLMFVFCFNYEKYHRTCVTGREEDMQRAGLWDDMQGSFAHRTLKKNFIDYFVFPIAGTLFGSIPGAVAEVSHFWTNKLVYTVSLKPQLRSRESEKSVELG